ncbi:acyl-ACP--UDP-N-acetylglucosamine O-acyltransferase [Prevotella sp. E13-27]|uniref:acyl-ACP--UDP-N-acetylglucosamine O-acyltransferase n=1 Tax=Prevotella sp. E13-27 TaxID=2938122 RepID=UPI00200B21E3|nr:acyl-ACP--UDP-N-acetylglucosamine O-acyltransferase [Prevotella sp. E13-27]MCK8621949.1 acyl-ACP--UDP-N-acetylglucosamine O-acyltransferase [Prevotella sp. E13-27]
MSDISPKAEISPSAKIGNNCKIFPFVYIEDDVVIGDNCIIFPFVSICSGTRMGKNNKIHQGSVIGALPQDFDFRGEKSECIIGNNNIIRENVVINRATHTSGQTVLGNDNVLMEGSHISHDTKVGDRCVFGYGTKIAGDCEIQDGVIFSSSVIENAKTRVGRGAMIQAGTTFSKDVPPYIICTKRSEYGGVNYTMGRTYGVDEKVLKHIANAYRLVYLGNTSLFDAVNQIKDQVPDSEEIRNIIEFLNSTKLGVIAKI